MRANSEVDVEIPLESIELVRRSARSKRSSDATNSNDDPVFYATLVSQQFSVAASQSISQVNHAHIHLYSKCIGKEIE